MASGDRNTAYFHRVASERRRRNFIHHLRNPLNTLTSNQKDIESIITNLCSNLFTTQHPSHDEIQNLTSLIPLVVSQEMRDSPNTPFSKRGSLQGSL